MFFIRHLNSHIRIHQNIFLYDFYWIAILKCIAKFTCINGIDTALYYDRRLAVAEFVRVREERLYCEPNSENQ